MSEITLLDYNLRQLRKTFNKKYENYIVTRIFHGINSVTDDIQMITQQYIKRENNFALTDLYFPQFKLHIEIDEYHHENEYNKILDVKRELEIVEATTHYIERIKMRDFNGDIYLLNQKIDSLITNILNRRITENIIPWHIGEEYNLSDDIYKFLEVGEVKVSDNLRFRTIMDASNFFGQEVEGMQRGFFKSKKYPKFNMWFPKFYKNNSWDNKLVEDAEFLLKNDCKYGDLIQEKLLEKPKGQHQMQKHYNNLINENIQRIVLPRFRDNLGFIVYKFMGIYKVDKELSSIEGGMIYRRISEKLNLKQ